MVRKFQVGLYGGTFDPLHNGHLNLAIEILEACHLDEVWFCPAKLSPHKQDTRPVSDLHRVKMLKLALARTPLFKLIDIETKRPAPSYAIDTLRELIDKYSDISFSLILGDDLVSDFFQWKNPREIIHLVPLLIGTRKDNINPVALAGDPEICQAIARGIISIRKMNISATEVRARLKAKQYCGHLVPSEILDYIFANQLYLPSKEAKHNNIYI